MSGRTTRTMDFDSVWSKDSHTNLQSDQFLNKYYVSSDIFNSDSEASEASAEMERSDDEENTLDYEENTLDYDNSTFDGTLNTFPNYPTYFEKDDDDDEEEGPNLYLLDDCESALDIPSTPEENTRKSYLKTIRKKRKNEAPPPPPPPPYADINVGLPMDETASDCIVGEIPKNSERSTGPKKKYINTIVGRYNNMPKYLQLIVALGISAMLGAILLVGLITVMKKNNGSLSMRGRGGTLLETAMPSLAHSVTPSLVPSSLPSDVPSFTPTNKPSHNPSLAPSLSNQPSAGPSTSPSLSNVPSKSPSSSPTQTPSSSPTAKPSSTPSASPTRTPSSSPTDHPSSTPSASPTRMPSVSPTLTHVPSAHPTSHPTSRPSMSAVPSKSAIPSEYPTASPSGAPTSNPSSSPTYTPINFYVLGDIPIEAGETSVLYNHIKDIPDDADFVVFTGDMQNPSLSDCSDHSYALVHAILKKSAVPVFVLPGDSDWKRCPDPTSGWDKWKSNFLEFENNWSHPFAVERQTERTENFSFYHMNVLFVGVNVPGGGMDNEKEWNNRLSDNADWFNDQVNAVKNDDLAGIVLFCHGQNVYKNRKFFNSFAKKVEKIDVPTLYIHGDGLEYEKTRFAMDVDNLIEVQIDRGAVAPPVRVEFLRDARRPFEFY